MVLRFEHHIDELIQLYWTGSYLGRKFQSHLSLIHPSFLPFLKRCKEINP